MRRGFTLLELLTCVGIIAIVTAITFPVFVIAKAGAKRSAAVSNLKQLYVAIAIYRTNEEADGIYGDPVLMGLPTSSGPFPGPLVTFMNVNKAFRRSPCGLNPSWFPLENGDTEGPVMSIVYRPNDEATYGKYASIYKQNSLLFYDLNCDDPGTPIGNKYLPHRGIGVLVEGQLINQRKVGLMDGNDSWWSNPPGE